jgi:hypothetical protein
MRLNKTYASDAEAKQVSTRTLWKRGRYRGRIKDARERLDRHGRPMIELTVIVHNGPDEREFLDWLTGNDLGAGKLRSCCAACNALDAYNSQEITETLFPGFDVEVDIIVEKGKRGFRDQNRIEFYHCISAE